MLDASEGYTTEDGRKIGGVVMEMKNITLSALVGWLAIHRHQF